MTPLHKLIPSFISDICIWEKDFSGDAVTYCGPRNCAIQSAKHSGSNTHHLLQNIKRIRSLDIFDDSFNNDTGKSKPVMIVTVDRGLDENPRYLKTYECAINCFTTQDSDAFFLATNAPGKSASNRIECRTVKFSQELSELLLPDNKCRSHLNSKGETVHPELERNKFMHTGKNVAEIWSSMIINNHPVLTEYIYKEADEEIVKKSLKWNSNHIRESQYFSQIVKCLRKNCYRPFR